MDTKAILSNKRKLNELAIQHNKLTTLVACLLNEVSGLKKELHEYKVPSNEGSNLLNQQTPQKQQTISNNKQQGGNNRFGNLNDLRAEDILKQLTINTSTIDN